MLASHKPADCSGPRLGLASPSLGCAPGAARLPRPQTGWNLPAGRRWCQQHLGRGRDNGWGKKQGSAGTESMVTAATRKPLSSFNHWTSEPRGQNSETIQCGGTVRGPASPLLRGTGIRRRDHRARGFRTLATLDSSHQFQSHPHCWVSPTSHRTLYTLEGPPTLGYPECSSQQPYDTTATFTSGGGDPARCSGFPGAAQHQAQRGQRRKAGRAGALTTGGKEAQGTRVLCQGAQALDPAAAHSGGRPGRSSEGARLPEEHGQQLPLLGSRGGSGDLSKVPGDHTSAMAFLPFTAGRGSSLGELSRALPTQRACERWQVATRASRWRPPPCHLCLPGERTSEGRTGFSIKAHQPCHRSLQKPFPQLQRPRFPSDHDMLRSRTPKGLHSQLGSCAWHSGSSRAPALLQVSPTLDSPARPMSQAYPPIHLLKPLTTRLQDHCPYEAGHPTPSAGSG